jgi:hypothetical protein
MRRDQIEAARARGPRIKRLTSVARIGDEIGTLYRAMRHKELDCTDGLKMVQALLAMKACKESSEIEKKIAEIEAAIANRENVAHFRPKVVG